MQRRAPRSFWGPAILGLPLMALGGWWMVGVRMDTTTVGQGEWFLRLLVPAPAQWFQDPLSLLGVPVFALGIVLWATYARQPDPRRWLFVAARFPEFAVAGHLLLALTFLSVVALSGHVFAATEHGLQWRAIVEIRSMANILVAAGLGVATLVVYGLSFGSARRLAS